MEKIKTNGVRYTSRTSIGSLDIVNYDKQTRIGRVTISPNLGDAIVKVNFYHDNELTLSVFLTGSLNQEFPSLFFNRVVLDNEYDASKVDVLFAGKILTKHYG